MTSSRNVSRLLNKNQCHGEILFSSFVRYSTGAKPKRRDEAMDHEVEFHSQLADEWWTQNNALHALNEVRVPFIRTGIGHSGILIGSNVAMNRALEGVKILDVGCGGGILSEALARLRANVVGIDPSGPLIEAAKRHAALDSRVKEYLNYEKIGINEFCKTNADQFDAVVLSEVIEHVANKEKFLSNAIHCLKPKGSLFITTPNQTWASKLLIVKLAERLNILPVGTHDFRKFIKPDDLASLLKKLNCPAKRIEGILYNPLTGKFAPYSSHVFMYAVHAQKLA